MRILCALVVMPILFATPHQAANGSLTPEFSLEITAHSQQNNSLQWDFADHSPAVMRGDAIPVVAIRKTNTSNHEILKFPFPTLDYDWTVRNPSGDKLTLRKVDSRHCWIVGGGPGFLTGSKDMLLQPGESMVHVTHLSGPGHPMNGVNDGCRTGFEMSQPGTYTLQVAQHVSNDPNSPEIRSNVIAITILAAENSRP